MKNKILRLYILSAILSTAGVIAFADQPDSSLDNKPSVDTAATSGLQIPPAPTDATAGDTHPSYLYDLKKLIDKSRENIKEVNEKIKEQAILKRNQKREERAHEYYEKGVELTNEGKLDEAREYFEKAIAITEHPEMAGYIRESQRRLRKQEEALQSQEKDHYNQIKHDENVRKEDVETAYKEAVDLYKQKKYHPAKDAFDHIDEIAPDYRATNSYLKIIDQDIIKADAVAAKQQAVEIANQQKEAEAARAKEKQMWLAQIEEKEKEHKEAIDKQAEDVYNKAIELYKKKKFAEAKKKFEEVSWVIPDYKDTMKYLGRIDKDAQLEQQRVVEEQQNGLKEQKWEELVASKKQEALRQHELEIKGQKHRKELEEQAEFLYTAAVTLYDKKNMQEALEKFNDIEQTCPDYKATRTYIASIEQSNPQLKSMIVVPPVKAAVQPDMSVQIKLAASLADQQKQVDDISELARRAEDLYSKVADIGDDSSTAQMKRKMVEVDDILNNLKNGKERILHQMQDEQSRRQEQQSRAKMEAHWNEIEKMYQLGRQYLRSHDYMKAKNEFLLLDNMAPNYKATRHYLSRIEEDLKESNVMVVTGIEQNKSENLRQLQGKQNTGEMLLRNQEEQQEQEKQHTLELQQQASLKQLTQKASDINDDIIRLSKQQDYEGIKAKFTELENTIAALTTLKDAMANKKDRQKREKELSQESVDHSYEMMRKENRPVSQSADVEQYKHREIVQEQNMIYNEAVDCYKQKKYPQAKLLFSELAEQHDRRAGAWLKKVQHALTQEILIGQAAEEKERTAFLADQVKAQRELVKIQERERQHQKELTEELERQKRFFEDDRLLQLRKEETMKAQERERQIQEEKRLQMEKAGEAQQEMLRFHKVSTGANPPSGADLQATPGVVMPSMDPKLQAQLEAQREVVHKQLEDGVEAMYQEALSLYKQGEYSAAADKFKDVQDILPGYKSAGQYMNDARLKSLNVNSPGVITPDASGDPASVSHQNVVSKALDLFDSNVK